MSFFLLVQGPKIVSAADPQCGRGEHSVLIGEGKVPECIEDDEISCPRDLPGTHYDVNAGICVPDGTRSCGTGMIDDGHGECKVDEAARAFAKTGGGSKTVGCHLWPQPTVGACLLEGFYTALLAPAAMLLGIAGAYLDFSIATTIIGFPQFVKGTQAASGAASAIYLAWRLIYDALTMLFIFIVLYLALETEFGSTHYQKALPRIIIAGLFINLTFFFTSALIDIDAIPTVELHKAIVAIGTPTDTNINSEGPSITVPFSKGLSGAFMQGLQFHADDGANLGQKIVGMILSFVVILIAAFIFFVMGTMFNVRFVILLILLITSAVSVMGGFLPRFDMASKKWWDELLKQLIFPPVFMLFMLVVVLIINSSGFRTAIKGSLSGQSFFNQMASSLLGYGIVIGLMIAGLMISQMLAGTTGKAVTSWASKKAGSLTFGSASWVARQAAGNAGQFLQNNRVTGALLTSKSATLRSIGKGAVLAGNKAQTSSFDLRGTGLDKVLGTGSDKDRRMGGLEGDRKRRAELIKKRGELYAEPIALENKRNDVAAKERAAQAADRRVRETEAALKNTMREGGTASEIAARRKQRQDAVLQARREKETADKNLSVAKNALTELEGGFKVSEARKKLQEATEKLTARQIEEAKASADLIETMKKESEQKKAAAKRLEGDLTSNNDEKRKAAELAKQERDLHEKKLRDFIAGMKQNKATQYKYIEAQETLTAAQKAAKEASEAAKEYYGGTLVGSMAPSTRAAADELRKRSKKPEQTILDELKKVMESQTPPPATPPPTTPPPGPTPGPTP